MLSIRVFTVLVSTEAAEGNSARNGRRVHTARSPPNISRSQESVLGPPVLAASAFGEALSNSPKFSRAVVAVFAARRLLADQDLETRQPRFDGVGTAHACHPRRGGPHGRAPRVQGSGTGVSIFLLCVTLDSFKCTHTSTHASPIAHDVAPS